MRHILSTNLFLVLILTITLDTASATSSEHQLDFTLDNKTYSIPRKRLTSISFMYNEGAPKKIKIATLDWPPYIAKDICYQGWVQQLTIAYLASQGYEVTSTFYPWARAVAAVESGEYDVLYPEYFIEPDAPSDVVKDLKRLDLLSLTHKIPGGPIALMKRVDSSFDFDGNLDALKNQTIGVVRGYQNTPEFDKRMDNQQFRATESSSDYSNTLKLINKRVRLIVGDPSVIYFNLLMNSETKQEYHDLSSAIEVVSPALQYNYLYYAVSKNSPQHDRILKDLNQAIEQFNQEKLFIDIIKETNQKCGFKMETLTPYTEQ